MTRDEAARHMRENTPLDQLRHCMASIIGAAEQAEQQRFPPSPLERRVAEFQAVDRLLTKAEELGFIKRIL